MSIITILSISLLCITSALTENESRHKAKELLQQMTTEEKLSVLHGYSSEYVGYVNGIDRLGIPALKMQDGPQGFRDDQHPGSSTCWPSVSAISASWDLELIRQWGQMMGAEFYGKGVEKRQQQQQQQLQ